MFANCKSWRPLQTGPNLMLKVTAASSGQVAPSLTLPYPRSWAEAVLPCPAETGAQSQKKGRVTSHVSSPARAAEAPGGHRGERSGGLRRRWGLCEACGCLGVTGCRLPRSRNIFGSGGLAQAMMVPFKACLGPWVTCPGPRPPHLATGVSTPGHRPSLKTLSVILESTALRDLHSRDT